MQNERLAFRQNLADAYRGELARSEALLEGFWTEMAEKLDKIQSHGAAAFAAALDSGLVDSAIIFDEHGRESYPNIPSISETDPIPSENRWAAAGKLEQLSKDLRAAADAYGVIAREATNVDVGARALQAQARCLLRAGRTNETIQLITERLGNQRFDQAIDPQGRLIVANCELMVLELLRGFPSFDAVAERLKVRLMDYDNAVLAASQRLFLMHELRNLSPETDFPSLAAEEMAALFLQSRPATRALSEVRHASLPNVWQFATPNGRLLALFREENLLVRLRNVIQRPGTPTYVMLTLLPPGVDAPAPLLFSAAGKELPGWHLALSLKDQRLFETASQRRVAAYLWAGLLVVLAMLLLASLAGRLVRRQVALARLKNDLVANVSHELKTPLSSMRVLVDTLLHSAELSGQTTREYLQLIAKENERLSRLIDNFLTFSRLERDKNIFHFADLRPDNIVAAVSELVRARLSAPGCQFQVEVQPGLPAIVGDPDALTTALLNLLDNAFKYSHDIKRITLRASAREDEVVFEVEDNGAGIPAADRKKIFKRFYQIDRRLSREAGGCGLGLSIVQYIAAAHGGQVRVDTRPGHGSKFSISIPVTGRAVTGKEAVA